MLHPKLLILFSLMGILFVTRILFVSLHARVYHEGDHVRVVTLLLSDVDTYSKKSSFYISLPDTFPPNRALVSISDGSNLHYGQLLSITGTFHSKVLSTNKTILSVYSPHITIISFPGESLFFLLFQLRNYITKGYILNISDIDSSLLLGIVFGIKANMPVKFSHAIQATGVTHVIAASGMNVTMVAGFLIVGFGRFFNRKIAITSSLLGLFFYAVFAGLQPSILRATIMGSCLFIGQLFGRQYKGWYVLLVTGLGMVLLSPGLVFDIGFELSFLSTLGIMTIQPLFKKTNLFTEDLVTTISAQVATVPIILVTFGQYSMLSIIVNGLVLWTIPPLMLIGSIAAFVGFFSFTLEKIVLFFAIPFLWLFETVVELFAGLPTVLNISIDSPFLIIGYYLLVLAILFYLYNRRIPTGVL